MPIETSSLVANCHVPPDTETSSLVAHCHHAKKSDRLSESYNLSEKQKPVLLQANCHYINVFDIKKVAKVALVALGRGVLQPLQPLEKWQGCNRG